MQKWFINRRGNKCLNCKNTGTNPLNLSTLKSSTYLNMQQKIEEYDKAMNDAKENGKTETIEELDKLSHILEYKM